MIRSPGKRPSHGSLGDWVKMAPTRARTKPTNIKNLPASGIGSS